MAYRPQKKAESITKASIRQMNEDYQVVYEVPFDTGPVSNRRLLYEDTINILYGDFGIGKSRFVAELGLYLQNKYGLNEPGTYLIQTEKANNGWAMRGSEEKYRIQNWVSLVRFVDKCEADPSFVKTVKMFVVDTLDGIIPKLHSTLCVESNLVEATDDIQSIYGLAKMCVEFQLLRLHALGPGILILSHEREDKVKVGSVEIKKKGMGVSPSLMSRMGALCTTMLRMRNMDRSSKTPNIGPRCLVFSKSDYEDGKDNLEVFRPHHPKGFIEFDTEKEAVENIMACFGVASKTSKKKKHSKKKSKKKVSRRI